MGSNPSWVLEFIWGSLSLSLSPTILHSTNLTLPHSEWWLWLSSLSFQGANDYLTITYCESDDGLWELGLAAYNLILTLALLFLAFRNAKIASRFRQEGKTAKDFLLVEFVAFLIFALTISYLQNYPRLYLAIYWLFAIWTILIPALVLTTLFLPKVSTLHSPTPPFFSWWLLACL